MIDAVPDCENGAMPARPSKSSGPATRPRVLSGIQPTADSFHLGNYLGALRNWALALHAEVAPSGVQVGHVAIGTFIGQSAETSADAIAPLYWDLHTGRDALEYLLVGARAVQIGTANLYEPNAGLRILSEIRSFLVDEGIDDVNRLVGALRSGPES